VQSFGVHDGVWHVPRVEPGGFTHPPPQQSELVVQDPLSTTHDAWHRPTLLPFSSENVQGLPQQSASDPQSCPAGAGAPGLQRA
jgi:hypothetical protein